MNHAKIIETTHGHLTALFACTTILILVGQTMGQELTVDCSKKHQTITGLGTCGMHWTGNDLFDNKDIQKAYVEDLGASILRWAVPCTKVYDDAVDLKDISYKNFKIDRYKKSLDWVGAIYNANPKEMTVVASVWSPPPWMKTNGSPKNGGSLKPECVEHYAKYLAEWVLYMKEVQKTPIHFVSLQNELQFKEPYESCVYTADFYVKTAFAVCDAFKAANLNTKLFGPEDMTRNVDFIVKCMTPILQDPRGKERFTVVASHGYVDGIQAAGSAQESAKLWKAIEPMGLQWWMSETSGQLPSFMSEAKDEKGKGKAGAFSLGNKIHNALVYGNASAWIYWCISGRPKTPNDEAACEALMNADKPTKKFYVSKQFYKYIRPGAVRVDAGPDGENNLQISAFLHEKNKTLTVVLLNYEKKDVSISLSLKAAPAIKGFEVYRTSESEDFSKLENLSVAGEKVKLTLPAQSIVTLYGEIKDMSAAPAAQDQNKPENNAAAPVVPAVAAAKPAETTENKSLSSSPTPAVQNGPAAQGTNSASTTDDAESQAKRRLAAAKLYINTDPARAKDLLRKVIEDFANTETAKDARKELGKLN